MTWPLMGEVPTVDFSAHRQVVSVAVSVFPLLHANDSPPAPLWSLSSLPCPPVAHLQDIKMEMCLWNAEGEVVYRLSIFFFSVFCFLFSVFVFFFFFFFFSALVRCANRFPLSHRYLMALVTTPLSLANVSGGSVNIFPSCRCNGGLTLACMHPLFSSFLSLLFLLT
jgi:hypothetical protein